jgi:hypothetical protein
VDLRDPKSAIAERIGKLRLFEKFIQPLDGRGVRDALDFGKKTDVHVARPLG